MRQCPHCKIEIIGNTITCPMCQNDLRGEGEKDIWPFSMKLKKQSLFYRLQLFVMLAGAMVCGALDFLFDLHGKIHWSVPVILWIIALQVSIVNQYKHFVNFSKLFNRSIVDFSCMIAITAWYLGYLSICLKWILPIILIFAIFIDFILMLIDNKGNALVYCLSSDCIGMIGFCIYHFWLNQKVLMWNVAVLVGSISLVGALVFKGTRVMTEAKKRLSM